MTNNHTWVKKGPILFTILLLIISLLLTASISAETSSDQNLGTLYLSRYYLIPDKPGDDGSNKTILQANNQSVFGHNVFDRKFDSALLPAINLWIDDKGSKGLELEFEIEVQAVEDNTVVPGKTYKMIFKNFTTQGKLGPYLVKIEFINYLGNTFDIMYGKDNWASIALVVKRLDNETGTKLIIYHGAEQKTSYIQLPWDQTLSKYQEENDNKDNDTPGFGSQIAIVCFISIVFSIYISNKLSFKKKK